MTFERGIVLFPLGGCREGFRRYECSLAKCINPSLPLHNSNAPLPREGIKSIPNTCGDNNSHQLNEVRRNVKNLLLRRENKANAMLYKAAVLLCGCHAALNDII
jgi:hypothetical protein